MPDVQGPPAPAPAIEDAAARTLDRLLERLGEGPWASRVLLLPQNPVLDQDTAGIFRPAGFADAATALVQATAERHAVPVVDGRRWVPAGGFFDFAHVFPNYRDFQEPLAAELAPALRDAPRGG